MSAKLKSLYKHQRTWIPWLVGFVLACAVIFGWRVLNHRETAEIERSTSIVLEWLQIALVRDLDARMSALQRLAERWSLVGGTSRPAWDADVVNYIADQPGYQAIGWADASLHVRRIMPKLGNEGSQDLDISRYPKALSAAQMARKSETVALSAPVDLARLGLGFVAYQPVYQDGEFDGLMIGVFQFDAWLDNTLNSQTEQLVGIQVWMQDELVYNPSDDAIQNDHKLIQQSTFSAYGRDWTIRVWLSNSHLAESRSLISEVLLVMGLLVSALLGWSVRMILTSREHRDQLHLHTQRLEALWENLPGMAYRSPCEYHAATEFVSDGCFELTGYSKAELQQKQINWNDIVHSEDEAARWDLIQSATSMGQAYRAQYRIVCRDGQEKWVWEKGRATDTSHGDAEFIEGLVIDVTDQKQTEAALIDATNYAKTVVDTAAEAIITIDSQGRIESFNRSAEKIFGYSRDEVKTENVQILMPEPYHSEHDAYLGQYLETGERRIIGIGREVSARRKDGVVFPIHLSVSDFVAKDERKFVGLIRDLTTQRAAEQEASVHRGRLAHVDRVNILGEMATGIAHEINQPLSAISMYAQSGIRFLDAGLPKPERLREALQKLSVQAHRAGAVIERMQQFSRQRDAQNEEIDCNQLMREVAHLAESDAMIRDVIIELDLGNAIRKIVGDPVQLQQVALNLLRNGMESMDSIDHRHGNQIILRTRGDHSGVSISIIDQGTGVSKVAAEQLYQPFASTKDMGMGIGLTICKSIVHAHGGQLDFSNHDEHGATFYFTLPYSVRESL